MNLTFNQLRGTNIARCEEVFLPLDAWSPTDWACAMAGETGEACNLIKKLRRGENIKAREIGDELADIVIYADLLAARLGLDLGEAIRHKFNATSLARGSKHTL